MPSKRAPECASECQQAVDYGVFDQYVCKPTCVYLERMRAEFERWYSDGGTYLRTLEREGDSYKLMSAHIAWTTWQAAWASAGGANFPESQKREGLGVALLMMAWEAGELSEGQMARLLNVDRVTMRAIRQDTINAGLALAAAIDAKPQENSNEA